MKLKYFNLINLKLLLFLHPQLLLGMEEEKRSEVTPRFFRYGEWKNLRRGYCFKDEIIKCFGDARELNDIIFAGDLSYVDFSYVTDFCHCNFALAYWSDKKKALNLFVEKTLRDVTFSGDISFLGLKYAREITAIKLIDVPEKILLSESCNDILKNKGINSLIECTFTGDFSRLAAIQRNNDSNFLVGVDIAYIPDEILRKEEFRGLFIGKSADYVHFGGDVSFLGLNQAISFEQSNLTKIPDSVLLKPEMAGIFSGKSVMGARLRGNISQLGLKDALNLIHLNLQEVSSEALLSKELKNLFKGKSAQGVYFSGDISQLGLKKASCLDYINLELVPDKILLHPKLRHLFAGKKVYGVRFGGMINQLGLKNALSFTMVDFSLVPQEAFLQEEMHDLFSGKELSTVTIGGNIAPLGIHKAKTLKYMSYKNLELSDFSDEMISEFFAKNEFILDLTFSKKTLEKRLFSGMGLNKNPQENMSFVILDKNTPVENLDKYKISENTLFYIRDLLDIDIYKLIKYVQKNKEKKFRFIVYNKSSIIMRNMLELVTNFSNFKNLYDNSCTIRKKTCPKKSESGYRKNICDDLSHIGNLVLCIAKYGFPESQNINEDVLIRMTKWTFLNALGFRIDSLQQHSFLSLKPMLLNRKFLLHYSLFPPTGKKPIRTLLQRIYKILQVQDSPDVFLYKFFNLLYKKDISVEDKNIIDGFLRNSLLIDPEEFLATEFIGK